MGSDETGIHLRQGHWRRVLAGGIGDCRRGGPWLLTWHRPLVLEDAAATGLVEDLMRVALDPMAPVPKYSRAEISPRLWPNGSLSDPEEWLALARRRLLATTASRSTGWRTTSSTSRWTRSGAGQAGTDHDAPLHPGLVWAPPSGAACRWPSSSSWSGLAPRPRFVGVPLLRRGSLRRRADHRHKHENVLPSSEPARLRDERRTRCRGSSLLTVKAAAPGREPTRLQEWSSGSARSSSFTTSVNAVCQGEGGYNEDHEFFGYRDEI